MGFLASWGRGLQSQRRPRRAFGRAGMGSDSDNNGLSRVEGQGGHGWPSCPARGPIDGHRPRATGDRGWRIEEKDGGRAPPGR
eukprot:9489527-Pyramimonas_sp.AAC.1